MFTFTFYVKPNDSSHGYTSVQSEGTDRQDAQDKLKLHRDKIIAYRRETNEQRDENQKEYRESID